MKASYMYFDIYLMYIANIVNQMRCDNNINDKNNIYPVDYTVLIIHEKNGPPQVISLSFDVQFCAWVELGHNIYCWFMNIIVHKTNEPIYMR